MKPLLSLYYQYLFAGHAPIDLSRVPPEKQQQRRDFMTLIIRESVQTLLADDVLSLHFRRMLRQAGSELEPILYGNQIEALGPPESDYEWPGDVTIQAHFQQLNSTYRFFKDTDRVALDQFRIFLRIGTIYSLFIEKNPADQAQMALNAYKMLVWYGYAPGNRPFARVENQISRHERDNPLSDTLRPDLPVNSPPIKKLDQWRRLIELHGQIALRLFQQAQAIERGLKKNKLTLDSAIEQAAALRYARASDYPELARLCYEYDRSEAVFNQCLAIKPRIKANDRLPDIVLDGRDFGYGGYYLLKMPVGDPHAYLLGDILDCGQSIGYTHESAVREGLIFKNNGFLILLKEKKPAAGPPWMLNKNIRTLDYDIVAQGYLWHSTSGLVLNSWESIRPGDEAVGIDLLKQYGAQLIKEYPDYRLFSLGAGGGTPAGLLQNAATPFIVLTDPMIQGKQHPDSLSQFVLAQHNVIGRRRALSQRLPGNRLGWDPDQLAVLIQLDDCYTDSQFSSIEETLFNDEMSQLIRMFEARNPEKFTAFFLHETPVFLGLLYTLKQLDLTDDRPFCCQALAFTHTVTTHTLKILCQHHLLEKPLLTALFASQDAFNQLTDIILTLALSNALNQQTLHLLMNEPSLTARRQFQQKITCLANKSHVFSGDFAVILQLPPALQHEALDGLCSLSEAELFTVYNRRCLLAYPAHAQGLLCLFGCLKPILNSCDESDYALLQQHLDKLPLLQTAAVFLADRKQLNRMTWRTLAPALVQKKAGDRRLQTWLEQYCNRLMPLTGTSKQHGLFLAQSAPPRDQDSDGPPGRPLPP